MMNSLLCFVLFCSVILNIVCIKRLYVIGADQEVQYTAVVKFPIQDDGERSTVAVDSMDGFKHGTVIYATTPALELWIYKTEVWEKEKATPHK